MKIIRASINEWAGYEFRPKKDSLAILKPKFFVNEPIREYPDSAVTNFKDMSAEAQHVSSKGGAGTLGGAAVGGLVFGGIGAIVGGMAGGNNTKTFGKDEFAFQFDDGTWLVAVNEYDSSTLAGSITSTISTTLRGRFGSQDNPFK